MNTQMIKNWLRVYQYCKQVLSFGILFCFLTNNYLQAQDIIYTVSGLIENNTTSLDSIIVQNFSDDTKLVFRNLPVKNDYQINLTKNAYWGTTGIAPIKKQQYFYLLKNVPGSITIGYKGENSANMTVSVFNLSGQMIFVSSSVLPGPLDKVTVNLGKEGVFIVKIENRDETYSFKGTGVKGSETISCQNESLYSFYYPIQSILKSSKLNSAGNISFKTGDSIKISAFKKDYYSYPSPLRIAGSGKVKIQFTKITYTNVIEKAYPDSTGKESTFVVNGDTVKCMFINGEYVLQGDIILTKKQLGIESLKGAGTTNLSKLWPEGMIYYKINSSVSNQNEVKNAIAVYHNHTPLTFKEINQIQGNENINYIEFIGSSGSNKSNIGMIGGRQIIEVSQNANYGRIIHEIGHAVGLIHEHSRTDRDNYIKMNWINIYGNFPKDFMQFWKMGSSKFIEGFDFNSVMLYSSKIMNSSGKEVVVMTKLNGDTWEGQRACLSPGDLNIIEELYGANAKKRPVISTDIPGDIKELSATLNGNVVFDGGKNITSRGFAWCKAGSGLYKIELVDGSTGKFSFSFSGLQPNTEYLFYAFASNSNGTTTGDLIRFTTKATANEPSSVTFNGYTYKTVKTGTQWWFAENLQTTQYSDGTAIPNVTDNNSWLNLTTGAYCWYNNDIANKAVYGALYNWYAVNTGKLCPSGWHVPTDAEWKTLEMSLGMTQAQSDQTGWRGTNQGTQMKSTNGWYNNGNGSNSSGFSGLPGGYRIYNGTFGSVGSFGYWWSSTELSSPLAWYRYLYYYYPDVARTTNNKQYGFSVRCIRD